MLPFRIEITLVYGLKLWDKALIIGKLKGGTFSIQIIYNVIIGQKLGKIYFIGQKRREILNHMWQLFVIKLHMIKDQKSGVNSRYIPKF